jgi:glycosyltransferase involved in cell wall biosynthesis
LAGQTNYSSEELELATQEFGTPYIVQFEFRQHWTLKERLLHEISPGFMDTFRLNPTSSHRKVISDLIEENDVVWVHNIHTANNLSIKHWPHSVLDIDDIPSRVYLSALSSQSNIMRKVLDMRMAVIWKRREKLIKERFSHITVCSLYDQQYLGREKVTVLPNGFDAPTEVPERYPSDPPVIGFIGIMKYPPNLEGVRWFIRDIWPLIKKRIPNIQLHLIGEGYEGISHPLENGIRTFGWVADPSDEIASWRLTIVPLRIGGGTRIKIAEAFARKCPVVSTSLGAFGYDVINGKEILIADNPKQFAGACINLVNNPRIAESLSEAAWKKFLDRWTWGSYSGIVKEVIDRFPIRKRQ